MPSSCWSSLLSLPTLRGWEVVGIRQNIESKTGSKKGDQLSYTIRDIAESTPSSFILLLAQAPRSPQYPSGSYLTTLETQTKGGVRLSLPGLHVRNWVLD